MREWLLVTEFKGKVTLIPCFFKESLEVIGTGGGVERSRIPLSIWVLSKEKETLRNKRKGGYVDEGRTKDEPTHGSGISSSSSPYQEKQQRKK